MTVYFITRKNDPEGLVKIGYTSDMVTRMTNLRTAIPEGCEILCTVPGGRDLESYLHLTFDAERVAGEWFKNSEGLSSMIKMLGKYGLKSLPAGVAGGEYERQADAASRQADLEIASRLLKKASLPTFTGDSVKQQIARAARRLGCSASRAKDIWYTDSRVSIAAWEMRKLYSMADMAFASTKEQQQILDLQTEFAAMKGDVEELRAFAGVFYRSRASGE